MIWPPRSAFFGIGRGETTRGLRFALETFDYVVPDDLLARRGATCQGGAAHGIERMPLPSAPAAMEQAVLSTYLDTHLIGSLPTGRNHRKAPTQVAIESIRLRAALFPNSTAVFCPAADMKSAAYWTGDAGSSWALRRPMSW